MWFNVPKDLQECLDEIKVLEEKIKDTVKWLKSQKASYLKAVKQEELDAFNNRLDLCKAKYKALNK